MRTFCAVRHMARVECVTVQVRWSQSRGGEVKVAEEASGGEEAYLDGFRRTMSLGAMARRLASTGKQD